jgi:hypothetical protein
MCGGVSTGRAHPPVRGPASLASTIQLRLGRRGTVDMAAEHSVHVLEEYSLVRARPLAARPDYGTLTVR